MHRLCYGCFQNRPDRPGPCPLCGFDPTVSSRKYPLALPPGSILAGRYLVGKPLGQGGFGITYTARDLQTEKPVAVKEFFPEGMARRQTGTTQVFTDAPQTGAFVYGREKFLDEACTLSHFVGQTCIVEVYSYFEENGTGYFTMELLEGRSFKQVLQDQQGRMEWRQALDALLPVFDALDLVHAAGIIHRDVSPDNIYLCRDGRVKLLDFGAARYSLGDRTQSLSVILKPGYAPAEQYARRGRQGPWTDVYALAATLYRAITGRMPPDSMERLGKDQLPPPSALGVMLPSETERALLRGLAVHAGDRWQSAGEFKQALLGAIPVPPSPEELREQARREAEEQARRRAEEKAQWQRERRRKDEQLHRQLLSEKGRRQRRIVIGAMAGLALVVGVAGAALGLFWQKQQDAIRYPFRCLNFTEQGPEFSTRQEAQRRLSAVGNAGNTGVNLYEGGQMAATEGLVLTTRFAENMNLWDGQVYYTDLNGALLAADGSNWTEVLCAEETSDWREIQLCEEGAIFRVGDGLSSQTTPVYLCPWTGEASLGAAKQLFQAYFGSPLCREDGYLYYNDQVGGAIWRCHLETGETSAVTGEGMDLRLVMDGRLYGTSWTDGRDVLWHTGTDGNGYAVLCDAGEGRFLAVNGLEGEIWYLADAGNGPYLARIRADEGKPEILYGPLAAGDTLMQLNLTSTPAGVAALLTEKTGDGYQDILVDSAGNRYSFDQLAGR